MKAAILTPALLAVTLVTVTVASAQDYQFRRAVPYGFGGGWGEYRHASTYEEGVLRGTGAMARGFGEFNYLTSLALINGEEARSKYIDNKLKATQAYFQQRSINRQARELEAGPRPSSQDVARYAKERAPKGLTAYQYEPALKRLFWPTTLEAEQFTAEREAIDTIMAARTVDDSGLGSKSHRELTQLTAQLKSKLKAQMKTMAPAEYIAAKKFLTGVELEAANVAGIEGVAAK